MFDAKEILKSFANQLAEVVLSKDGAHAVNLLYLSGLLGKGTGAAVAKPAATSANGLAEINSGCIGIWERKESSQDFVRRLDMAHEWSYWANLTRIEPKRTKLRVVLIGESVARGYLYDPQFTPAMVLERILQAEFGTGRIEVVDLARTDLLGHELGELAIAAAGLLEPDAVVIFAGNNWATSSSRSASGDLPLLSSVLQQQGIAGTKQLAEARLAEQARHLVQRVGAVYESKGIPLLWMVPEFNLVDWRDPMKNAPYLFGAANREWIAFGTKATDALLAGDIALAIEYAGEMVKLDGGVSIAGYHLLAEAHRQCGDLDSARHHLECARDAVIWDSSIGLPSPRPYSVVQDVLRCEPLTFRKGQALDVPALFKEYLTDALPDRRLFLDYCHLTSEGIQVAMAAAASRLSKVFGGPDIEWRQLLRWSPSPGPKIEAEAAFLAAVHNAHWYQNRDIVTYNCLRAVKLAPEISEVMLKFVDIQCRRHPMYMYEAAEKMAEMPWLSVQRILFQLQHPQLDKGLLDAIAEALQTVAIDVSKELNRIRREEHSFTLRPVDLLDYYYCCAAVQPQELIWNAPDFGMPKRNHYYKAYWVESKFFFVGERSCTAALALTCRLPSEGKETISIEVNGKFHAEAVITNEWLTWDIDVPEEAVMDGVNEVVIHWPIMDVAAEDGLRAAIEDLRHNLLPEFYPAFGEIHSFTARYTCESGHISSIKVLSSSFALV